MNERNGGGKENGAFGDDDETKVEVGGGYILGAGRRLAVALHGAGSGIDEALDLIESSPGASALPAIEEVIEYLENLKPWVDGALRAAKRIEDEAHRNGR